MSKLRLRKVKKAVLCCAKSLQFCPTLYNPKDCSPPGSSVYGIFQARVLKWGAIAFSCTCINPNAQLLT